MAVTADRPGFRVECPSCSSLLRYLLADVQLPSRAESGVAEDMPAESATFRYVICPNDGTRVTVPIHKGDPWWRPETWERQPTPPPPTG